MSRVCELFNFFYCNFLFHEAYRTEERQLMNQRACSGQFRLNAWTITHHLGVFTHEVELEGNLRSFCCRRLMKLLQPSPDSGLTSVFPGKQNCMSAACQKLPKKPATNSNFVLSAGGKTVTSLWWFSQYEQEFAHTVSSLPHPFLSHTHQEKSADSLPLPHKHNLTLLSSRTDDWVLLSLISTVSEWEQASVYSKAKEAAQ